MAVRCCTATLPILVVVALLFTSTPVLAQRPRAERPTYLLGEKWIRNDGVFDLIRVEKDGYVFAADGGREVHLSKDLMLSRISRRGELEWDLHPTPKLTWPLAIGKWGETTWSGSS